MAGKIEIASVCERDIDLLLLEEFRSSISFQDWFIRRAFGDDAKFGQCFAVRRSVTHSTGESDLEIDFKSTDGSVTRLMIENKVDAGLQKDQASRYVERGNSYVASNSCADFRTAIVAPLRYFGNSTNSLGFDSRFSYEDISSWFSEAADIGERRYYKLALLGSAIDKATLGYQPEMDAPVSDFWRSYWQLASIHAPELEMREPKEKPSGSSFVHFRPPTLPKGADIVHKLSFGHVDLHLRGMGKRLNEVRSALAAHLESDMSVEPAAGSAAIRIKVPKLHSEQPFSSQHEQVMQGLSVSRRLLYWALQFNGYFPVSEQKR